MSKKLKIILKSAPNKKDIEKIKILSGLCTKQDNSHLKLELDYKSSANTEGSIHTINDFFCYEGGKLIAYLGICLFGNQIPELTGMVHPDYQKRGVFSKLLKLALMECVDRGCKSALLLCDRKSLSGKKVLSKLSLSIEHSEHEMIYKSEIMPIDLLNPQINPRITIRKALKNDSKCIEEMNMLFFGNDIETMEIDEKSLIDPEMEAQRGFQIYIAELDSEPIGKIHVEVTPGRAGIYGFGVIPKYRKQGFGKSILSSVIKMNPNKIIFLQVSTTNETALTLYQKCGFILESTMDYYQINL